MRQAAAGEVTAVAIQAAVCHRLMSKAAQL